jgi:Outer membrane protein beta-barrel domain
MKRLVLLVGFVTLVASPPTPAAAQRAQNIEFGGFGSWWRFDRAYGITNSFGGGARIGYNLGDKVGLEVTGDYIQTTNLASTQNIDVQTVSAGLVLNFPVGDQSSILASGGYARMIFGKDPPYNFTQHMVYGGLGFRLFVSHHVALRGDVRAEYNPKSPLDTTLWTGQVQGSVGLSYFFIPPQQGRGFNTNFQWYWGGQGGFFISKTNTQPYAYDPIVGGHWLITSRRTALYVAYEQAIFLSDAHAVIYDPASSSSSVGPGFRDVTFHDMRRLMFGVLAYPTQKVIEPFGGGGFALMQVLNPAVDCSKCASTGEAVEAQNLVDEQDSKAFFWLMGGLQINYSSKFNVFAHYLLTSTASNFLLLGNTHTFQGGVRISLGTSKEGIGERH